MNEEPDRRRRFFFKRGFQGKFILLYAAGISTVSGLTALGLYLAIHEAVDAHLYDSHLEVERTGELLFGIVMKTNGLAALAVVAVIIVMSIIVFGRLNRHFQRMEERLDVIIAGDFRHSPRTSSRFNEVSTLIEQVDRVRELWQARLASVDEALDDLEQGFTGAGDPERLRQGKEKLDRLISGIDLPQGAKRK